MKYQRRWADGESSERRLPGGGDTKFSIRDRIQVGSMKAGSMGEEGGREATGKEAGWVCWVEKASLEKGLCLTLVGQT